jgi:hypothetical protein
VTKLLLSNVQEIATGFNVLQILYSLVFWLTNSTIMRRDLWKKSVSVLHFVDFRKFSES